MIADHVPRGDIGANPRLAALAVVVLEVTCGDEEAGLLDAGVVQPRDQSHGALVGSHEGARVARDIVEADGDALLVLRHRGPQSDGEQHGEKDALRYGTDRRTGAAHAAVAPGISLASAQ